MNGTEGIVMSEIKPKHMEEIRAAKEFFDNPSFLIGMTNLLGKPADLLMKKLPKGAANKVDDVVESALNKCLGAALKTVSPERVGFVANDWLHKVAVAATGAAGGGLGITTALIELPFTTTIMFRSICEIAAEYGEDLNAEDSQLACLSVFAFGGPSADDDEVDTGYYMLRAVLAQESKNIVNKIGLEGFVKAVARRFSVQVTETASAKIIPGVGAVLGGAINIFFMDYFQDVARAHFSLRRLERTYGEEAVKEAYGNA